MTIYPCAGHAAAAILSGMIVTHTQNAEGHVRIYLGGKGSLECWIEPNANRTTWRFHMAEAVSGNQITDTDKHRYAVHNLLALARALDVPPGELGSVSFETIASLHDTDPFAGRRVAAPKRRTIEQGFMSTAPNIRRPANDFRRGPQPGTARTRS